MQIGKSGSIYITILFVLTGLSIAGTYYRYMVRQDFVYFTTEDQIPSQFDVSSYPSL